MMSGALTIHIHILYRYLDIYITNITKKKKKKTKTKTKPNQTKIKCNIITHGFFRSSLSSCLLHDCKCSVFLPVEFKLFCFVILENK